MSKDRFKTTVAVNLILSRGDEILLLKREHTKVQDGMYSLIAGHLEHDELGTEAVIREAKEEANITIDIADLKFAHLVQRLPQTSTEEEYIDIFYKASNWQGDITNNEPGKCSEISWFPKDNLPPAVIPLLPVVLAKINDHQYYSEYRIEPS